MAKRTLRSSDSGTPKPPRRTTPAASNGAPKPRTRRTADVTPLESVVVAGTAAPETIVEDENGHAGPLLTHEAIAERAYHIYLERGATPGDPFADWVLAERQLRERFGFAAQH